MIYRREVFQIVPKKMAEFNEFFHEFLLPNQIRNGTKLIPGYLMQ